MIESFRRASQAFMKRPVSFALNSFLWAVFQLLLLFAFFGIVFILFSIAALLKINVNLNLMAVFFIFWFIFLLYLSSGVFGSLLYYYNRIINGGIVDALSFFRYAMNAAPRFFSLAMIQIVMILLFVAPLVLAYLFVVKKMNIAYAEPVTIALSVIMAFFIRFILHGAFLSAAAYETKLGISLKHAFSYVRRGHIMAFFLFTVFVFAWLTLFIPLVGFLSLFITIPVLTTTMLLFFQKKVSASS